MPTIAAGQLIDSYRIVRQIGAGGMGAVYEATHVVLGQRVAIKVLTSDYREQPSLLQRFINEARAASQSNHPGIVKVYDLGYLEGGQPWLSMEYLEGHSLAARIHAAARRGGGALGFGECWIVGDIASALAAAHAKGIIHRDLKPGNVMIVPDPATLTGERAKVVDFGVAKLHSDQLTKRGAILGTPLYMALEQFKDSAEVDGRADVFSLGVIAYELLTGRRPHQGQTHYEVMGSRLLDEIQPLKKLLLDRRRDCSGGCRQRQFPTLESPPACIGPPATYRTATCAANIARAPAASIASPPAASIAGDLCTTIRACPNSDTNRTVGRSG